MRILFLLSFGVGLAIAVYAMLHGVEKQDGAEVSRPAPYLNLPSLAALLVVFGAVGYLLLRSNPTFGTVALASISSFSGLGGWLGMSFLMAKWALRPSLPGAHHEAEEIQGQLAQVVDPISSGGLGSIRYERDGVEHRSAARGITQVPLPRGADVVIDRIDADVAVVEDWASVEQRL